MPQGNQLVYKWAKAGAKLREAPSEQEIVAEACERGAEDESPWLDMLHDWLHAAGFQDSHGVGGAADQRIDLDFDASQLEAEGAESREKHCERRGGVPPEMRSAGAAPAASTVGDSPVGADDRLQPWPFQGREVVRASARGLALGPPGLFCTGCGANVQKSHAWARPFAKVTPTLCLATHSEEQASKRHASRFDAFPTPQA
ncbi:unnamed protein product [Prorocentrum cordatum]|uniref:Uncharacterized protein n=1 Tax=Prorocentrum cordatum TaxID=2364126 RepID=A0ABN9Y4F3_9DINO|nr:unnamed protein product [Polarella glacialis]